MTGVEFATKGKPRLSLAFDVAHSAPVEYGSSCPGGAP